MEKKGKKKNYFNSCQRCLNKTKRWSIRTQMMVCYLTAMITILILIIFLVIFNVLLLKDETLNKVDETLDEQSEDNMVALVRESAAYLYSEFQSIKMMLSMLQEMVINMLDREQTISIAYLPNRTYGEIQSQCTYKNDTLYPSSVCLQYSSYLNYGTTESLLAQKISRFDVFWPTIYQTTSYFTFRYQAYINTTTFDSQDPQKFIKVYPGQYIPFNYNPFDTVWYSDFQQSQTNTEFSIVGTRIFDDPLGPIIDGQPSDKIVSLVSPLYNNKYQFIGTLSSDISVPQIYRGLDQLNYLKEGQAILVCNNGDVIQQYGKTLFKEDNISGMQVWKEVVDQDNNQKQNTFLMDYEGVEYRIASAKICSSIQICSDEFWYILLFVVQEDEIMRYKHESEQEIQDATWILLAITITSSVITIIVIIILIHYLSKSITEPLQGIIDFTNKINANATEQDVVTEDQLEQLKLGEDQVAHLVRAFKGLASGLIHRREERVPLALQQTQNRIFPPNEFYKSKRIDWKALLDSVPN